MARILNNVQQVSQPSIGHFIQYNGVSQLTSRVVIKQTVLSGQSTSALLNFSIRFQHVGRGSKQPHLHRH